MLGKGCLRGRRGQHKSPGPDVPAQVLNQKQTVRPEGTAETGQLPERLRGAGLGPCTRLHELLGQAGPHVWLSEADDESS